MFMIGNELKSAFTTDAADASAGSWFLIDAIRFSTSIAA